MEKISGFFSPLLVYLLIFILNAVMPGRWVTGYVTDKNSGEKLRYRLNGLSVLFTVILFWVLLCYYHLIPWTWFYEYRWYGLAGAIIFGLIFSFSIVLPFTPVRKSFLADFFFGRLENPQLWGGRIDAKMWLYLAGAVMLELNILSFAAHHTILYGEKASQGIYLATFLLTFFIVEYLAFEEVHLYTYDFVAERVGFKLGWGCIAFYPYFYSVPLWSTIDLPVSKSENYLLVIYGLLFFVSWSFSRGSNLQKYHFRKDPKHVFFGIVPRYISDGNNTLLVNGYWGMSRHINYLGETGMAVAIVLCTGHPALPWPWLFPLYYVILFLTRQADDDRRCALKYGVLWNEYKKRVPYKIIPYIY